MQKGENIISIALAAVVFFAVFAIQRRWNPASLKEVATSAEDFILTTAGVRGQVPDIAGYERVETVRLEGYRAGLYRATPAPLVFATGRLVIYDRQDEPVFTLETLEGSKEPWTALYDFAGRRGLPAAGNRARPDYARDLTGDGVPDAIIGQYSGGDHCCTVATIVELGTDTVRPIGRIDGLDGIPFEGLEVRKLNKDTSWECIAHRSYLTACGTHAAADVISVYAFANGRYTDQTARFEDYLQDVLRQNLARWRQEKNRSLDLLQTLAVEYAVLGQQDQGKRFFVLNLSLFTPSLRKQDVDPNACLESLEDLVDRVPGVEP
ncbi:MAG: hypothetical protein LAO04_08375 [Acidobacteriia bacterium]|nr:hypothetical protein [Terriglobia bacterium]